MNLSSGPHHTADSEGCFNANGATARPLGCEPAPSPTRVGLPRQRYASVNFFSTTLLREKTRPLSTLSIGADAFKHLRTQRELRNLVVHDSRSSICRSAVSGRAAATIPVFRGASKFWIEDPNQHDMPLVACFSRTRLSRIMTIASGTALHAFRPIATVPPYRRTVVHASDLTAVTSARLRHEIPKPSLPTDAGGGPAVFPS